MPAVLVAEQTFTVGTPVIVEGPAPNSQYGAVFEDDGATGYFYGLDSQAPQPIVDARHVYNVEQVTDRDRPSVVQIAWSQGGLAAVLIINGHPHAVIDFRGRRGHCRTGFPPPDRKWSDHDAAWDDAAVGLFR